jgi:hypothetical protein
MPVALPNSEISIVDGGLGIVGSGANTTGKIGVSSAGTVNSFYSYSGTDTSRVVTDLGTGPLVDSIIMHLLESGGAPVIAYKATSSTAGTSTAVTQTGTGPTVTLTGAPNDQHEAIVEVMVGGVLGTSQIRYSLDGGDTWVGNLATAATILLPSGVTINMAAGSYVVGTTYAWTDTAPAMTTTNVGDALDAFIVSPFDVEFIHVVGQAADAAAAATMFATLASKVTSAHAAHKYLWILFEAPAVDKANLASSFAALESRFVAGAAGFCELLSPRTQRVQKRSSGRVLAPRIARNPIAIHPLRDVGDSDVDPISSIVRLVPAGAAASTGYHDEELTPGLNAARFMTLRTITGRGGFYPSNGITFASGTSDFQILMNMRIVLAGARAWYQYTLTQLARRIRRDPTTGYIDPAFADAIQTAGEAVLRAALGDAVRAVRVLVNRTDNLASDPTLRAKLRFVLDGYALEYESELGLASSLS